ncbi:hypothetical protein B0A48_11139 [Cryoendolithus antarcticus]|uniref:Essential protein Yae1 N-terminal domain-containing protein n=1 Tax=Cryoendolithus antarcticus TaxID=1507870 RepID=A0A1V8SUM4_9PEZI|nr:hypothetical protein B0A48_11139 [Cryoendolithus antarcticus]
MASEADQKTEVERAQEREDDDPFAPLLSLESSFYDEGYALGHAEGSTSGRIEGRLFGLSRGFEKFEEMGRLQGQASVWSARLEDPKASNASDAVSSGGILTPIKPTDRLRKQVRRLVELTDPEAVSTENSEDGVADFDERLKDAKAKGVVVSRMLGESGSVTDQGREESGKTVKGTGEMEDFGGVVKGKAKG